MNRFSTRRLNSKLRLAVAAAWVLVPASLIVVFAESGGSNPPNAWVATPRAARKENPIVADPKSVAAGKELFIAACMPCHGATGRGDGPAAAALERDAKPIRPGNLSDPKLREQTDGALFWKMSEGRTPMPAFQEVLTEEQRWQIVNYVRTLAVPSGTNKSPTQTHENKP